VPTDQGASQRRSYQSDNNTPIGQGSTVFPKTSSGESYLTPRDFGPPSGHDYGSSNYRGTSQVGITFIGNYPNETTSARSRSQVQSSLNVPLTADRSSAPGRQKERYVTALNSIGGVGSAAHGAYLGASTVEMYMGFGMLVPTIFNTPLTTYYKLLARDSVTGTAVRWVSNQLSLANAPASPDGNPLLAPTVEGFWTQ